MVIGFSVPVKGFFNFYGKKQKWKKNLLFCVNSVTKDISYGDVKNFVFLD